MNKTRWSSKVDMLRRYMRLSPYLEAKFVAGNVAELYSDSSDISESVYEPTWTVYVDADMPDSLVHKLLSPGENTIVEELLSHLKIFQEVQYELQKEECNINLAMSMFDALMDAYPVMSEYLSNENTGDAARGKVFNPHFLSGIQKIQSGIEDKMTKKEKEACKRLIKANKDPQKSAVKEVIEEKKRKSFVTLVKEGSLKRKKTPSKCVNTDFVKPTSNTVEWLFSKCRRGKTDYRGGLSPVTFEAESFLRVNNDLWDAKTVKKK